MKVEVKVSDGAMVKKVEMKVKVSDGAVIIGSFWGHTADWAIKDGLIKMQPTHSLFFLLFLISICLGVRSIEHRNVLGEKINFSVHSARRIAIF